MQSMQDIANFMTSIHDIAFITKDIQDKYLQTQFETDKEDYEPTSFKDAWDHPNEHARKKWREAIEKEFQKMKEKKVWIKIKQAMIPKGRRCVKHKWVFKIKRNGVY